MKNVRHWGWVAFWTGTICSLLSVGCRKESDRPTWDVDLLVPLVRTSFTIRDLVADSLVTTDPQGTVTLLYRSDLFKLELDTLLLAPDTSFTYRYALPIADSLNFPAGFNFFSQNDVQRFDLEELALRTLVLREGRLELRMDNRVNSLVIGTLDLPGAIFPNGGTSMTTSVGAGTPSNPTYSTAVRDLAGTSFDLRGPQFNAVNTLETSIGAMLDPAGQGAWVTADDSLVLSANYLGLVPQYARGYFGQRTVEAGPDTNDLSLFDALVSGTLDLDVATLRLTVENGFGLDLQVRMRQLSAINTRTGNTVDLTHTIFQGPININRAIDLGSGFIPSQYSNTIDVSNSNIDLFLENLPDQIGYELDLGLNPLGDISSGNDFLYYESELKAGLELEVPLRLITNELTLQTVSTPDLPRNAEGHALRSGELKLFATNGFPMSARFELDLIDANGEMIATIPVDGIAAAGLLGANNLVTARTESVLTAELSEELVNILYAGARLRSSVAFTTSDQSQHLRILDSYRMDLQITLAANYMVNGDE
ncbi:MAG: hypothetical protein IPG92_13475 [Flavobacteriales bacterium]|nr:hypothetical protein [Flavobacteriales bacterium]